MDELPSAEFRKQYARLTAPVVVTVNGHPIGVWQPATAMDPVIAVSPTIRSESYAEPQRAQTQRDDLLRKINRGK